MRAILAILNSQVSTLRMRLPSTVSPESCLLSLETYRRFLYPGRQPGGERQPRLRRADDHAKRVGYHEQEAAEDGRDVRAPARRNVVDDHQNDAEIGEAERDEKILALRERERPPRERGRKNGECRDGHQPLVIVEPAPIVNRSGNQTSEHEDI